MRILKMRQKSNVVVQQIELKPLQCILLLLFKCQENRIYNASLNCRMFVDFFFQEAMPFAISQRSLRSSWPEFSEARMSTFFIRAHKNTPMISRKFTEDRMVTEMAFRKIWSEVCKRWNFGLDWAWNFSSSVLPSQLYCFHKMPKKNTPITS